MKKTILFIILILTCSRLIFAQAPQGLNYQAVAYNSGGSPVANQSISVRLSILDVSATGTLVYQETQNPATDNTGLFSVVIGNGTVVSGTFNTINWGNGAKFLKTEIDITGGSSYVVMGTSQFMSVPYALYANMAASSATFQHPDGLNNITPIMLDDTIAFTVPAGKNLYVNYDFVEIDTFHFVNYYQTTGMTVRPFIGASYGAQVKSDGTGFLVDATVQWKSIDVSCVPYTVPVGKIFIIYTAYSHGSGSATPYATINGIPLRGNISCQILKAGDVLFVDFPCLVNSRYFVNGYLKDN